MPIHKKKTDSSQKNIIAEMRQIGIQAIVTNGGKRFPDVLCGWAGQWILLEIKELGGALSRGQLRFLADSRGPVAIVIGSDAAIQAVTDPNEYCLSNGQRDRIVQWLLRNPDQQSITMNPFFDLIAEI